MPSTVSDLATTIFFKKKNMGSTSFYPTATVKKKKTSATFGIYGKELVQVALLQIHGGDGAYL